MILATFDLQITPMLPSKFGVNWPFSSEEEVKTKISRWLPWRPSWISDWNDFSNFLSITPKLPTKFGVNWLSGLGEEAKNKFSRWLPRRPSWIPDRHDFSYF